MSAPTQVITAPASTDTTSTTEIAASVESIKPSRESLSGFSQNSHFWTSEGPVSISLESNLGREFQVWDGVEFVKGVPKKTTLTNDLIRVVTSDASVLDCMADQEFLMADGSKKRADQLKLDDELARSIMPAYEGNPKSGNLDAFMIGAIYGTCVAGAPGGGKIDDMLEFQAPYITLDQKLYKPNPDTGRLDEVPNPHLATFGYNMRQSIEFAKANGLGAFDHDTNALIIVPEGYRKAKTLPNAPLQDRKMWCAGFGMMTSRYTSVTTARGNVDAAISMINSTGQKYEVKAEAYDSEGRWQIKPIYLKEDDPARATLYPKVVSVSRIKTRKTISLYSIDGLARGQAMINRLLVPIVKNKPPEENDKKTIVEDSGEVIEFD